MVLAEDLHAYQKEYKSNRTLTGNLVLVHNIV